MIFHPTPIHGVKLVELDRRGDERGFFARFFCEDEFRNAGLCGHYAQMNDSLSTRAGTLRGMHYQLPPHSEVKVVRCIAGALYDVALDLRPDSPTFGRWFGQELNSDNRLMMCVPKGCAHGFVTLVPDTEVLYLVSDRYAPGSERGIRYDDSAFGIRWPVVPSEVSAKDRAWPDFDQAWHGTEALRGLL